MISKSHLRQYYAAFSCQMSCMMTGACFVWFTPLMARLLKGDIIPMSREESSWVVAFIEVGELFSPIPAGMLVNRFGRKWWMLTTFPLILSSWILLLCTRSVEALYVVRLLQGLSLGVLFTVSPIYLAEISEPKIRGAICGHFQTMWTLGYLYAYVTGPFLEYEAYAYACAALTIVFLLTFIWAPETPYFYLLSGREEEARESLKWLRDSPDVSEELDSIKRSIDSEMSSKQGGWTDLFATPQDRKSLLVVSSVCFVKYMSGMPAIASYISDTLSHSGGNSLSPDIITIIIGSVMLLATVLSAFASDVLGRRPLVFISTIGSIVFNGVAAIYYYLEMMNITGIKNYTWIAYICLAAYCIINSIGLSPLLQTLQAEYFPSQNRGIAGAFISFLGTIFTFIVLKQYQTLSDWLGIYSNYLSFSLFSLIGSFALFAFMKETAGKSLGEIQEEKVSQNHNGDLKS